MSDVTIYHNPRCSKSCETLALLEDKGIQPDVVLYLQTPPSVATLRDLVAKLGVRPIELVRKKEQAYKALNLADHVDDDDVILQAMADHPVLIERPIVVKGAAARLGRPPEQVVEIL